MEVGRIEIESIHLDGANVFVDISAGYREDVVDDFTLVKTVLTIPGGSTMTVSEIKERAEEKALQLFKQLARIEV